MVGAICVSAEYPEELDALMVVAAYGRLSWRSSAAGLGCWALRLRYVRWDTRTATCRMGKLASFLNHRRGKNNKGKIPRRRP